MDTAWNANVEMFREGEVLDSERGPFPLTCDNFFIGKVMHGNQ